jgi:hypothetical protein
MGTLLVSHPQTCQPSYNYSLLLVDYSGRGSQTLSLACEEKNGPGLGRLGYHDDPALGFEI